MEESFSIQPYICNSEILSQTAEQIKKDFGFFQLDILLNPES